MKRYRTEIEGVEQKRFFQVVKAGFGQRRKTLRNSLKALGIPGGSKRSRVFEHARRTIICRRFY